MSECPEVGGDVTSLSVQHCLCAMSLSAVFYVSPSLPLSDAEPCQMSVPCPT